MILEEIDVIDDLRQQQGHTCGDRANVGRQVPDADSVLPRHGSTAPSPAPLIAAANR